MGPSVKFVLAIIDSISKKKMGVKHEGGGGPRASCLWMQKIPIFIFEYFPYLSKLPIKSPLRPQLLIHLVHITRFLKNHYMHIHSVFTNKQSRSLLHSDHNNTNLISKHCIVSSTNTKYQKEKRKNYDIKTISINFTLSATSQFCQLISEEQKNRRIKQQGIVKCLSLKKF